MSGCEKRPFDKQALADPRRARIVLVESPATGPAGENWLRTHGRYAELIRSQFELLAGKGLLPEPRLHIGIHRAGWGMNELLLAHCTGCSVASIGEVIDELVHIFLVVEGGCGAR